MGLLFVFCTAEIAIKPSEVNTKLTQNSYQCIVKRLMFLGNCRDGVMLTGCSDRNCFGCVCQISLLFSRWCKYTTQNESSLMQILTAMHLFCSRRKTTLKDDKFNRVPVHTRTSKECQIGREHRHCPRNCGIELVSIYSLSCTKTYLAQNLTWRILRRDLNLRPYRVSTTHNFAFHQFCLFVDWAWKR